MRKYLFVLIIFVLMTWFSPSSLKAAYENKYMINVSTAGSAYDLHLKLKGVHEITWKYNGHLDGWHFLYCKVKNDGSNTTITWTSPRDSAGNAGPIPRSDSVHVGWEFAGEADILHIYWTDELGDPLQGSLIINATTRVGYNASRLKATVRWRNSIVPYDPEIPYRSVTLTDLRYTVLDEQVDPDSLNLRNVWLQTRLQTLHPGPIVIPPGDSVVIELPDTVQEDQWIVVRFNNYAPGLAGTDSTDCIDFVEWLSSEPSIPTLTEWGMIIFGVVLLGFITWVFLKRRRAATVRVR